MYEDEDIGVCEVYRSIQEYDTELREERIDSPSETSLRVQDIHRGECEGNPERYGYIYITENLINHKKYIGQHKSKSFDKTYKGSGDAFRLALKKYGKENFKTEIIEWCSSLDELNEREIYWIAYHDAVKRSDFYNEARGGGCRPVSDEARKNLSIANKGRKFSDEHRTNLSKALSGENNPMYGRRGPLSPTYGRHPTSEEIQKRKDNMPDMGGKNNPMYGKHHTEESNNKNRQAHLGKKMSEEFCKADSIRMRGKNNPMYGKHHSKESREKNRKSHLGKKASDGVRKKMSESRKGEKHWNYGKHHSEESREKNRQSHLGMKASEETKRKMSDQHKGKPNMKLRKSVQCVETGQVFSCAKDACIAFSKSENSRHNITRCARSYDNGEDDIAFGYHWRFI